MKRAILTLTALAVLALAPGAQADLGISKLEVRFSDENGDPATQAGSHPFAVDTFFELNHSEVAPGKFLPDGGDVKDLVFEQARGFIGAANAVPRCSTIDFVTIVANFPSCPDNTAVGITAVQVASPGEALPAGVFNLTPPPGVPVRLGFVVSEVPVAIDLGLKQSPDYNILGGPFNSPQVLTVFGAALQIWGTPADPVHDFARGECAPTAFVSGNPEDIIIEERLNLKDPTEAAKTCSAEGAPKKPLLTLPRSCQGGLTTAYKLDSWSEPGVWAEGSIPTGPFSGCGKLEFSPEIASRATTESAGSGSGLDFEVDFEDETDPAGEGLTDPDGLAQSEIKEAHVALPEGVTANPSLAEGLGVCTPADLNRETISSEPGEGCPNASKIGTVSVQTPIVDELIEGSVFLAQQDDPASAAPGAENPFDSLIAFYIVLKNKNLGALVKVPAKVEPDPQTGQLVTIIEDVPQIPFTRFKFHFREGQRAPLITPPACGTHTTTAEFVPWARPGETLTTTASFEITQGVGGGPCPPGGVPPFKPGFEAGALNNNAASYSPFLMRLTRQDGEQDMTKFSTVLPPGATGKLAGVGRCSEIQIAHAQAKSGRAERALPSCPAASLVGHTVAGAGVGSALTYVPGSLYLAGPYKGSPLSVVAITPAVAGPFDVGTVVVRVALTLNPKTAQVEVDGSRSDPIPHILKGIPLKLRDLRVSADRPQFTLNPTSCDESSTRATLFGSNLDLFSAADDLPVALRSRYQTANCARLGYKPKAPQRLKGGTKRGAHPALRAMVRPRAADANTERIVARLPRSAFLDQAHIRTVCTRVQFAADACPQAAVYGRASVFTPLLDEPLSGPVYLRSSNNKLPDLVLDLKGIVDIEVSARIDSVHGGIRATFDNIPDAPFSKAVLQMQGGQKGLIINSRNLCARKSRANIGLDAQNGKRAALHPLMQAQCHKRGKRKHSAKR